MKITPVTIGEVKERYSEDATKGYSRRSNRYCKLKIIQIVDEETPSGTDGALGKQIEEEEGQRILSSTEDRAYVVVLAIEGRMPSSEGLALKL